MNETLSEQGNVEEQLGTLSDDNLLVEMLAAEGINNNDI